MSEARNVVEELLDEVIAFGDLQDKLGGTDLELLCGTVPPDRSEELRKAEKEIQNLKARISTLLTPRSSLTKPEQTSVPPDTVPPDIGVARSSRRRGWRSRRRGKEWNYKARMENYGGQEKK